MSSRKMLMKIFTKKRRKFSQGCEIGFVALFHHLSGLSALDSVDRVDADEKFQTLPGIKGHFYQRGSVYRVHPVQRFKPSRD